MPKQEKWMSRALGKKRGALRRQLQMPKDKRIPKTLLEEIVDADIGDTIRNPTKIGEQRIKVTKLLKQRAVPALTARRTGGRKK